MMLTCKHCPYETRYKQILTRHMKTKHKDQPFEKEKYECKYCLKQFASRPSCKRHELRKICCKSISHSSSSSISQLSPDQTIQTVLDNLIQSVESPPIIVFKPPSPLRIPEIVAESDFEESPIKNKLQQNFEEKSPSIVQRLLQFPVIRLIKYIGCSLWIFHMIQRRHQSSSKL